MHSFLHVLLLVSFLVYDILEKLTSITVRSQGFTPALGDPSDTVITRTIENSIGRLARPLSSFLARTWNVEGITPGSQFETIYLGGGGAYYFEDVIWESLPGCHIVTVPDPHRANLSGYLALATALPEAHWKHDPWPERLRSPSPVEPLRDAE